MADPQRLRKLYESLSDDELVRISRSELVLEARDLLNAEMTGRGLAPAPAARNPYLPPAAPIADLDAEAALSGRGLVRLFQSMVVASTAIGAFLWIWPYLPLPISEQTMAIRDADGVGALLPWASYWVLTALQPIWVVAGIGLYFFLWWGRLLLAAAYAAGVIAYVVGGMIIWLPWEAVLVTLATLLDGAILALAFLPPLSKYFERP
jgi:hypothetical protein